ncbi:MULTISPECIES: hypothetical protein [unclassified Streptomyces]|uniref:hypothetical protein n=1 Tax=unclassified Streptomyces TaxID=2593676 RepID=UPI0036EA59FE
MPQTSPVRVRVALTGTAGGAALIAPAVIAPAVEAASPSSYGVSGVDTRHNNPRDVFRGSPAETARDDDESGGVTGGPSRASSRFRLAIPRRSSGFRSP